MKTRLHCLLGIAAASCIANGETFDETKGDTSALAVFVDFTFEGTVQTDRNYGADKYLEEHLLYTVGHLNGHNSVGRIDKVEVLKKDFESVPQGYLLHYKVRLPVAWGRKRSIPTSYEFTLPVSVDGAFLDTFTSKYKRDCVDIGAHDVDAGSMWYYYRPARPDCELGAEDVYTTTATVTRSEANTTGKFPEYNKVWEDNTLNVLAIFGKNEDGATTAADAGIDAYNDFVRSTKSSLGALGAVTTVPANLPSSPGVAHPDISFSVTKNGRTVNVTALLTDNIRVGLSQPEFRARYEDLTERADLIAYNGHAGLGDNVRALARNGRWVRGQYVMVFVNGCDTFAYVDTALNDAHAAINPDDPNGTKYVDIITNAMPAYFVSMAGASNVFIDALVGEPMTYERIFEKIDSSQVILVQGEEDNTFTPGGGGGGTTSWSLDEEASIAGGDSKSWESPTLAAGVYTIRTTGTGDADLYVRIGKAPTEDAYDCRPYSSTSRETCRVTLPSSGKLFITVMGYGTENKIRIRRITE